MALRGPTAGPPTAPLGPPGATQRPRRRCRAADPSAAVLLGISEAELLAWVLDVARVHGWRSYHARPARTERGWRTPVQGDGVGWPDVILVRGGRGVALELKTETGRITLEQEAWIAAFALLPGWHAQVARPRDRDAVLALLAGERAAA